MLDSALRAAGMKEQTEFEKMRDEMCEMCPSLSYTQRLYGFLICIVIGTLLSLGSTFRFAQITTDPAPFAIAYTLGNIVSLAGTCFVVGPSKQLKNMFKQTRWLTSLVYILAMGGTLFCCLWDGIRCATKTCDGEVDAEENVCTLNPDDSGCAVLSGDCTEKCQTASYAVPLIIGLVILQAFALLYYIFSYIPYGRTLLRKCGKRCCAKCAGV